LAEPDAEVRSVDDEPTAGTVTALLRQMVVIREFEQATLDLYARAEILGIAHVSIGQEAVPVGVCSALRREDYITSTHRGHGHCLAKGADAERMFAEMLGRSTGYCGGKGGSMHIADPSSGNLGANAIVGGSLGIATGAALASKLSGSGTVTVCFFGDGAANQGLMLEVMNMAAVWSLPCVYVCEDNQYGEYTARDAVTAGDISDRALALGMAVHRVDGMDVLDVRRAALRAVEAAQSGDGPQFLHCQTYRYLGHGMSDRDRPYRSRDEETDWRARDPIDRVVRTLQDRYGIEFDMDGVRAEVRSEISQAIDGARSAEQPAPEAVRRHVYAD